MKMATPSQHHPAAGWIMDNEYDLWSALQSVTHENGFSYLCQRDIKVLRRLAERAQGWIWTGPGDVFTPQQVPLAEWEQIFARNERRIDRSRDDDQAHAPCLSIPPSPILVPLRRPLRFAVLA
jgi:hypothetical protein